VRDEVHKFTTLPVTFEGKYENKLFLSATLDKLFGNNMHKVWSSEFAGSIYSAFFKVNPVILASYFEYSAYEEPKFLNKA